MNGPNKYRDNHSQVSIETIVKIKQSTQTKENLKATGNRISIIDNNNRLIEEFVASKVLLPTASNRNLMETGLIKFVQSMIRGHNLLLLNLGTTKSGKETLFAGSKSEQGIISMFLQSLSASLDVVAKAGSGKQSIQYSVRLKAVEIVDEKVSDLLSENKYTTIDVREDPWEGVSMPGATWKETQGVADQRQVVESVFKKRTNTLNELAQSSGKTAFFMIVEVWQLIKNKQGVANRILSKAVFCEIPGLEVLKNSQQDLRVREEHASLRGVVGFCALIKQLAEKTETSPLYEASKVTHLLKEYLGGNAFAVAVLNVVNGDPEGCIKTLKCLKELSSIGQYPIYNNGQSIGLLHKLRLESTKQSSGNAEVPVISHLESQKQLLQGNINRIRLEDDYKRMLEKYTQVKNRYNGSLKAKNEIQLELIKSEEEKLEISKTLVEVQIQNTRLLEELQNKDYQMGRKMLKAETNMIEKEVANSKYSERIKQLEETVTQTLDAKRDLEVEFIALKKNYITMQKDLQQLKKANESLGLDFINMSNENKYLQERVSGSSNNNSKNSFSDTDDYTRIKLQKLTKDNQTLAENEKFLKSQVERYRAEIAKYELALKQNNIKVTGGSRVSSRRGGANDYDQLELENEKIQLSNRLKLLQRKIDELQEINNQLTQDSKELGEQNQALAKEQVKSTEEYRSKLQAVAKADPNIAVAELKQNFNSLEKRSKQKLAEAVAKYNAKKTQCRKMVAYARQLKEIVEDYAPRGIQLPIADIPQAEGDEINDAPSEVEYLRTKSKRLEQEVVQLRKQVSRGGSAGSQVRPQQQAAYLRNSRASNNNTQALEKLKQQRNQLQEQNRKLVEMLKDANKMDSAVLQRQNQNLRRQLQRIKGKESVSPNSSDQKLIFYQKHLKKLEKERSELMVRCTMAEEQLKTFQEHYSRVKR